MEPTLKLKPHPDHEPCTELDLTGRAALKERPFEVSDVVVQTLDGQRHLVKRSLRRKFILEAAGLTLSEASTIRRWRQNRVPVAVNPNLGKGTLLCASYGAISPVDYALSTMVGPSPTYSRGISDPNAEATYLDRFGVLQDAFSDRPRIERVSAHDLEGLLLEGKTAQGLGKTHPTSSDLVWTLENNSGNASWYWEDREPSIYAPASGVAMFRGDNGDAIKISQVSWPSGAGYAASLWVRGYGMVELQMIHGGGSSYSGSVVIDEVNWTRLKIEDVANTPSVIRLYSRATSSVVHVGPLQVEAHPIVTSYVHNQTGVVVYRQPDSLFYDVQIPLRTGSLVIVTERPGFSGLEDSVLAHLQQSTNEFTLKYDASNAKYYFQYKTNSYYVEANPSSSRGDLIVLAVVWNATQYKLYENGSLLGAANIPSTLFLTLNPGIYIGHNEGGSLTDGWGARVYEVRLDREDLSAEMPEIAELYVDADQLFWTKLCRGRWFAVQDEDWTIVGSQQTLKASLVELGSTRSSIWGER